jgi:hypothetical protein
MYASFFPEIRRPHTGKQIGDHIGHACAELPPGVKEVYGRVDSGFYCRDAIEAYKNANPGSRSQRARRPSRSSRGTAEAFAQYLPVMAGAYAWLSSSSLADARGCRLPEVGPIWYPARLALLQLADRRLAASGSPSPISSSCDKALYSTCPVTPVLAIFPTGPGQLGKRTHYLPALARMTVAASRSRPIGEGCTSQVVGVSRIRSPAAHGSPPKSADAI